MKLQALGRYHLNGEILGKGNFARVELATHSVLNAKVAIKIIDVDKVKEDYVRRNLGREVKVLSRLRHPNIVRLFETMMSGHLYCLMMEFAPGGDLCTFVKAQKDGRFPESRARPFCRQLVSALTYMHGRGIIHRDLKMENIMLNATKDTLKIVDFGLSNCWSPDSPLKSHCGSPEYAAPELFVVGRTYGPEIDVWSMGVVCYVLLVGRLPFLSSKQEGLTRQERRDRLIAHINQGLGGTHRSDMKHLSSECRRLLAKVLEPLPARRLTLRHVAVHPWMTHKGLSPLPTYQHPRVGSREHQAAVQHMSEVLSIKPQLIEERVLKQMYDDIAGMYNILTHKPEIGLTPQLPDEARIRPLELRTPSKRPLTSGGDPNSPLRSDKAVRSAVGTSLKPTSATPTRSGPVIPRSGVSVQRPAGTSRDRPKPLSRRPAHISRPTTAPTVKQSAPDQTMSSSTAATAGDVTTTRASRGVKTTPPLPSAPSVIRRRPPPVTELLRSVNERLGREAVDAASIIRPSQSSHERSSSSAQMPPVRSIHSSHGPRARHSSLAHHSNQASVPASQQQCQTPTSGRGTASTSGSSDRAWESPRQRDDRKTAWMMEAPWDTPRRHNLTDDQKVRTDDRRGSVVSQRDKSLLLVSGAEDEFSSLYDDATDDSSAVDEPIRVVIRNRAPPPPPSAQEEVSTASSVSTLGRSRATVPSRHSEFRRPNTVTLDDVNAPSSSANRSSRHVGMPMFDSRRPEVTVRREAPPTPPRPLARKSPSECNPRDSSKPSPRGQHQSPAPQQHRRSALPLTKCGLRSPAKTTSSAHAWLSAHRSSDSWSSHDRFDFNGGREGRYQRAHQLAPPESKRGVRESETQTADSEWCERQRDTSETRETQDLYEKDDAGERGEIMEPRKSRESRSQILKLMVQREDLVSPYTATSQHKKKPLAAHRLYGSMNRRSAHDEASSHGSSDGRAPPRGKYRPQTAAPAGSGHVKAHSRVLRPSAMTSEELAGSDGARLRETRV